jgi:predicted MFS family arabinose efflux permease
MASTKVSSTLTDSATPRPVPLWRNRDYLLLWSGQLISELGSTASRLAFPLLILYLTGSPVQAGLLGAANGLPYAFLCLPAGAYIDRWNRKRVMILCDVVRALALGSIPLAYVLGVLGLVQLYVVAVIEGTLFTFFNLADTAALPQVIAKEQLPAATAQSQITYSLSDLLGPTLAGALYGVGHVLPFLVDAISYVVSFVSLFFIKTRFQEERAEREQRRLWGEIKEGIVWLWRNPLIRFICFLTGALNLTQSGFTLIIILLAQRYQATSFQIGLILGAGGVGGLIGAFAAPPIRRRVTFGQMLTGVMWLFTLLWPLLALAPNLLLLGGAIFVLFVAIPAYDITQFSYRIALIPDVLQGRVNSVFRLVAVGARPACLALTGALLQWLGPVGTVWVLFVPQVVLALAVMLNRHVQQAPPIEQARQNQ